MSSRTLYRLSGEMLIIGSLLLLIGSIVGAILFPGNETPQQVLSLPWVLVTLLTPVGSLLFVTGLPGMYVRQSGHAGRMGLVGFILLFLSTILLGVSFMFVQIVTLPVVAQVAPKMLEGAGVISSSSFLLLLVSTLIDLVGSIVLGIATMRARVFPRWAGALLIASGVLTLLEFPGFPAPLSSIIGVASSVTFGVAFLWCGYLLIGREHGTADAIPFATAEAHTSR